MKKGILYFGVSCLMLASLVSCGGSSDAHDTQMKAGLVALHTSDSTYDKNFIDAFNAACKAEGVTPVIKTNIPETTAAYDAAAELADEGCKFVFADSFGHEAHILKAAKEFKDVQFSHATGTTAHYSNVSNFHNAFASIYEGRYLAGVAAGLKLQSMIAADSNTSHKIGYVGAYTYAEVISGYTSFYLGVKSIVSDVTMDVKFTGSWYDETAEKTAAEQLIGRGCSLISQHADSWGAPTACETANVPNVSYNGSTESKCPNTYVASSRVNWEPYFKYALQKVKAGESIDTDWTGELGSNIWDSATASSDGSVALAPLGAKASTSDAKNKLEDVATKIKNGTLKIFDTSTFTVGGSALTTYKVDMDGDNVKEKEAIVTEGGITYFAESEFRSAPYFDVQIDGIDLLNSMF